MVHDKHFRAELISKTPGAQTREEALEHVRLRRQRCTRECTIDTPEPDFGPEPMPLVDDPVSYAQRYVERQKKGPPGRAPLGQLDNRHGRFRVVDGKDKGDNANE